jgi:hypothetical protein
VLGFNDAYLVSLVVEAMDEFQVTVALTQEYIIIAYLPSLNVLQVSVLSNSIIQSFQLVLIFSAFTVAFFEHWMWCLSQHMPWHHVVHKFQLRSVMLSELFNVQK